MFDELVKRPIQHFFERQSKKLHWQGARIPRNEAYGWYAAMTREEGQHGIWAFYEAVMFGETAIISERRFLERHRTKGFYEAVFLWNNIRKMDFQVKGNVGPGTGSASAFRNGLSSSSPVQSFCPLKSTHYHVETFRAPTILSFTRIPPPGTGWYRPVLKNAHLYGKDADGSVRACGRSLDLTSISCTFAIFVESGYRLNIRRFGRRPRCGGDPS